MRLSERTLERLAKMVTGDAQYFPYRKGHGLTKFFTRCGFPFVHDGTTRATWTCEKLTELNLGSSQSSDLPSADLCRVITELFDPDEYDDHNEAHMDFKGMVSIENCASAIDALEALNQLMYRYGIVAYLDDSGRCYLRSTGTGVTTANFSQQTRPLSQEEILQRQRLSKYLDQVSEDEFIEKVLVPLLRRLGFKRVSATGHKEKNLEFGKDLWMKYQLPTSHWIYFCAQVKKDKIDSNNATGAKNVANVLTQARMAISHPILDPEINRKVLLDHLYLISAGEITKQARSWLIEELDSQQRRHIIFMDRDELLDQSARILLDLRIGDEKEAAGTATTDDDIPF
jgi:Restriction endonuclease